MEAYSMDLRERVIEAYDAGRGSSRELAEVFDVSGAWIRKLLWLRRETGTVAAK
jgi:transposase